MLIIKGKKEMEVHVSSLLRNQGILLFNHNSSTFEPFYSSLPPPPVTSKSLPTKLKRSGVSSTFPPPLHQHCRKSRSIFPSHQPQLSTPLNHPDTLQPVEMKSFKIGFPSFVREKKFSSCPEMYSMVDATLSTMETEVERDEQILVVLEREARGGGDQIEVLGEK
jgi:hypothetical protein